MVLWWIFSEETVTSITFVVALKPSNMLMWRCCSTQNGGIGYHKEMGPLEPNETIISYYHDDEWLWLNIQQIWNYGLQLAIFPRAHVYILYMDIWISLNINCHGIGDIYFSDHHVLTGEGPQRSQRQIKVKWAMVNLGSGPSSCLIIE